jgi:hypothetical protein
VEKDLATLHAHLDEASNSIPYAQEKALTTEQTIALALEE